VKLIIKTLKRHQAQRIPLKKFYDILRKKLIPVLYNLFRLYKAGGALSHARLTLELLNNKNTKSEWNWRPSCQLK
jgi:hypothetical protein